jgi:hypothetical protein
MKFMSESFWGFAARSRGGGIFRNGFIGRPGGALVFWWR